MERWDLGRYLEPRTGSIEQVALGGDVEAYRRVGEWGEDCDCTSVRRIETEKEELRLF